MVSVPFKILRKETATSWVIREVTLSTAGRRGLVISKSSTTQLKAIGRHLSNTTAVAGGVHRQQWLLLQLPVRSV